MLTKSLKSGLSRNSIRVFQSTIFVERVSYRISIVPGSNNVIRAF